MAVLHVIPAVAERYGGPSRAVISLCRALKSRGVSTLVAATDADGPNVLAVPLRQRVSYQGLDAIFFRRQWSESLKVSLSFGKWLKLHVHDFDVVHIHAVFSHSCIRAAASCRAAGIPYVFRPLGTLDPWSLRQKPARKRLFLHAGLLGLLRSASAIHYTTPEEKTAAERELGLTRGVVIPLGVEDVLLDGAQSDTRSSRRILALSRLHPKKNIDVLIEAFAAVVRRPGLEDWQLLIAGDGEPAHRATLEAQAKRVAGDRIVFTGWLDRDDAIQALRDAAILVSPSAQENFGLSVLEAMACGVPVVVSPGVNLAGEIRAADAGWVVAAVAGELTDTLREAMTSPDERVRRGEAGRALARSRFSWSRAAATLDDLYRSFVGAAPVEALA